MTAVTAGTSKTFTAQVDGSAFVVIAPGGAVGSVIDQNGNTQAIDPNGTRRTFGHLRELQSITVSMQIGNASVELDGWSGGIPITAETNEFGQTVLDDASRAALNASGYSGWGKQIRVITIGDSITAYGSASGWMLYVEMVSNGRVKLVRDAAIAGNRTDQMVARFGADVTPYASQADELWIMTGANDATAGDTSTTFASDLSQLVDLGLSVGLRVRLFAMPPNDTSITNALKFREITGAVAIKKGVDFYDPWQTCVNPATGGFLSADTIDGVHPTAAGHTKAGQAVVAALAIPTTHNIALPVQNAANGGMMTNPLFVTDTNTDGLADGWGSGGAGVASLVASTFGNKQRFTATALTGPTYLQNNPILTVVPGNVYSIKGKLTVSGTDHNWYLRIRWQTAGSIDTNNLYPWNGQANATGEFEFRVTAPADATKLAVQFSLLKQAAKPSFSAVLDVEQFQIVDLTAIGLA